MNVLHLATFSAQDFSGNIDTMQGASRKAFGVRIMKTQQRRLAMRRAQEVKRKESGKRNGNLYLAFELGNTKWKLALCDGEKARYVSIAARV